MWNSFAGFFRQAHREKLVENRLFMWTGVGVCLIVFVIVVSYLVCLFVVVAFSSVREVRVGFDRQRGGLEHADPVPGVVQRALHVREALLRLLHRSVQAWHAHQQLGPENIPPVQTDPVHHRHDAYTGKGHVINPFTPDLKNYGSMIIFHLSKRSKCSRRATDFRF